MVVKGTEKLDSSNDTALYKSASSALNSRSKVQVLT